LRELKSQNENSGSGRYERAHSISAGHINWYEDVISELKICAILDDSSRKILAINESATISTENRITVAERAIQECGPIYPLRELIMDYGSEFGELMNRLCCLI